MINDLLTRTVRRYLVGAKQEFAFRASRDISLPKMESTDLYIHIPFCKNLCPYCPYNRIPYREDMAEPYMRAMLFEIREYAKRLGPVSIGSIYIGGGTPTNLINELGVILDAVRQEFNVTGSVCIETNPLDVTRDTLSKLTEYGVELLSLGIESFDDKLLQLIGRNYNARQAEQALELSLAAGFESVNIDLMFALPQQSMPELMADLQRALNSGVNQITTYPLFTFPYSTVGKYLGIKKVKMPNLTTRKRMYSTIHNYCEESGFERVSVWGFRRGSVPRYSSVTRNTYVGLGAGSATCVPGAFYMNTFSVSDYIDTCSSGQLPIALKMDFNEDLMRWYWMYWRLYDTYIPKQQMNAIFGEHSQKLERFLSFIRRMDLCEEDDSGIRLTQRGAFWLHLMQNHFSLNYINRVWSAAKKEPWPAVISF